MPTLIQPLHLDAATVTGMLVCLLLCMGGAWVCVHRTRQK